ncbi:MAG: hypothetical protein BZ137_03840 [Methanosphaera sp. rholeuAM130]|nr:3H domain-containing protein [Methanosphaera sp.]RAP54135.1 MAG: hypothetical protein BZ137_03840 [Methanosphaera sp. rholeuAM130]
MKPYVILIGSASGIGKSTIASEISNKLGIKYLIESDFIREIVRGIIGNDYAPALHSSSYNAYSTIRDKSNYDDKNKLIEAGFEEHASFVIPAIENVIKRSIRDNDSIVIEGVHLIPGLIDIEQFANDAKVFFFILTIDREEHQKRFINRAIEIKRGGKQLDYFEENRAINDDLIRKANKFNVPVIDNLDMDKAINKIMQYIHEVQREVFLKHSVDEIDLERDIITKYGGRIIDISYYIPDFKEPLKRVISNYDDDESTKNFLYHIHNDAKDKESLETLYKLSNDIHSHTICAPDEEKLNMIINEFKQQGILYDEKLIKENEDENDV